VFTNRKLDLKPVMSMLATMERERGQDPDKVFFHLIGDCNQSILNGSLSYPLDPASKVTLAEACQAVERGLKAN
jgi:hypothetical protein